MVGRLVEDESWPAARSSARCALVRSPEESVSHGRPTWSAPSPNFASSVLASTDTSRVRRPSVEQRLGRGVRDALLADHAEHDAAAQLSCPGGQLELAEERAEERRLPRPVRAGRCRAPPGAARGRGPEAKGSLLDDRAGKPGDRGREPTGGTELEPELPRLERLLR